MNNIRWLKKKNGKLILQHFTGVGQNGWGHVVFGWVDVETVTESEATERIAEPTVSYANGDRASE